MKPAPFTVQYASCTPACRIGRTTVRGLVLRSCHAARVILRFRSGRVAFGAGSGKGPEVLTCPPSSLWDWGESLVCVLGLCGARLQSDLGCKLGRWDIPEGRVGSALIVILFPGCDLGAASVKNLASEAPMDALDEPILYRLPGRDAAPGILRVLTA